LGEADAHALQLFLSPLLSNSTMQRQGSVPIEVATGALFRKRFWATVSLDHFKIQLYCRRQLIYIHYSGHYIKCYNIWTLFLYTAACRMRKKLGGHKNCPS
jgi:hypothetical protein